ncbi:hypothetical protein LIA77_00563 [Sarocladium implicatum]|nr:hypothetical protein LIA77_00563 [Sarocladium implicatum]
MGNWNWATLYSDLAAPCYSTLLHRLHLTARRCSKRRTPAHPSILVGPILADQLAMKTSLSHQFSTQPPLQHAHDPAIAACSPVAHAGADTRFPRQSGRSFGSTSTHFVVLPHRKSSEHNVEVV